jgi:hypothetical protein
MWQEVIIGRRGILDDCHERLGEVAEGLIEEEERIAHLSTHIREEERNDGFAREALEEDGDHGG